MEAVVYQTKQVPSKATRVMSETIQKQVDSSQSKNQALIS